MWARRADTAYTDEAKPETTFPFPMTDHGAEIASIMKAAIDKVMVNQGDPAEIFKAAYEEINGLF